MLGILGMAWFAQNAVARAVWIDTDVSIGSPFREVDDAYALVFALRSPELRITGCSTSYGNADIAYTTHAARRLWEQLEMPAHLPRIFPGASGPADRLKRTAASEALAEALRREKLTYVALGPLTNLAAMLHYHPELSARIERVILVGGKSPDATLALGPGGNFRVHDANVFKDPASVGRILATSIPITLVPVEVGERLEVTRADLRELRVFGKSAAYLERHSRIWSWFWRNVVKREGGPVFDALAVACVVKPELTVSERRFARLNSFGDLIASADQAGGRAVRFVTGFTPRAKALLLRRLVSAGHDRNVGPDR